MVERQGATTTTITCRCARCILGDGAKPAILGDFPFVARGLRKNLLFAISLVMTLALDRRGHGHVPLTDALGSSLCIHTAWG